MVVAQFLIADFITNLDGFGTHKSITALYQYPSPPHTETGTIPSVSTHPFPTPHGDRDHPVCQYPSHPYPTRRQGPSRLSIHIPSLRHTETGSIPSVNTHPIPTLHGDRAYPVCQYPSHPYPTRRRDPSCLSISIPSPLHAETGSILSVNTHPIPTPHGDKVQVNMVAGWV